MSIRIIASRNMTLITQIIDNGEIIDSTIDLIVSASVACTQNQGSLSMKMTLQTINEMRNWYILTVCQTCYPG